MIQIAAGTKVYPACRPVDMRRGFDGLSAEVVNTLNADPYSGHLFLFWAKRGGYLKALYWDGTGMCLFANDLHSYCISLSHSVEGFGLAGILLTRGDAIDELVPSTALLLR
ncbi:IS66 family insertion sequence element accessory protein TnpB [Sinorhizobium meliloti]|uniref:IS66 family insertion sequence element accessory protein TnpB n=1 Tax=Rhizobium meliloti TaxID=382 RepID=UPI0019127919|nr:IS66 family insertion sequence element accessory protein TnpB [Sinorhizobium meliloti]